MASRFPETCGRPAHIPHYAAAIFDVGNIRVCPVEH
jgi:hypothetical protein